MDAVRFSCEQSPTYENFDFVVVALCFPDGGAFGFRRHHLGECA